MRDFAVKLITAKTLATLGVAALLVTGCQNESATSVEKIVPAVEITPVAFNLEGAPTAEFHVPDMMCEKSCVPAVKKIFVAQSGVKDVQIDFSTRMVTVAVDEADFNSEAAVAALVDYQFGNSRLVTNEQE